MKRVTRAAAAVFLVAISFPSAGVANDRELVAVYGREFPTARSAGQAALGGVAGPETVQRQYNTARDLTEKLRRSLPVSRGCSALYDALALFARGNVAQAEGYDRQDDAIAAQGRALAQKALARLEAARLKCKPSPVVGQAPPILLEPEPGQVFFGRVVARVPPGARVAELIVDGREVQSRPVKVGVVAFDARSSVGRHDVEVRFTGRRLIRAKAAGVWLLPANAMRHVTGRQDAAVSARLRRATTRFGSYAAVYYRNFASGRTGSSNADVRFPAASTVKLGVLVAGLNRLGASFTYDLRQMARWSSNVAANRLLLALGAGSYERGAEHVETTLRRLGARSSTYPGPYRAGTAFTLLQGGPPSVSERVTTAADLARILSILHAAAGSDPEALRASGLTSDTARLALGYLLNSQASGDNLGLLRPEVPGSVPIARKEGWLNDARHSAAILFKPTGAELLVILTYREGITLQQARGLSQSILRALR